MTRRPNYIDSKLKTVLGRPGEKRIKKPEGGGGGGELVRISSSFFPQSVAAEAADLRSQLNLTAETKNGTFFPKGERDNDDGSLSFTIT